VDSRFHGNETKKKRSEWCEERWLEQQKERGVNGEGVEIGEVSQWVEMAEIRALWQKIGFEVAWCSRLEI
jgi:hypothetical protein